MTDPQANTQASTPIALRQYAALFGHYLAPQWRKATLMAALLLLGIAVSRQLLSAAATYLGADVGWSATNVIRVDLARHTLALDMGFHTSRTAGELIERLDGDVTALSDFFSQFSVRVFGGLLLLVGILLALWLENALVGLALTLFALLEREANAQLFGFVSSALDVETERLLWEGVFARGGATCLVVSHRCAALERADHILLLEAGRVAAEGTLEELLRGSEAMRRLWRGDADERRAPQMLQSPHA